ACSRGRPCSRTTARAVAAVVQPSVRHSGGPSTPAKILYRCLGNTQSRPDAAWPLRAESGPRAGRRGVAPRRVAFVLARAGVALRACALATISAGSLVVKDRAVGRAIAALPP